MKLSEDQEKIEISLEVQALLEIMPTREIVEYAENNLNMIHVDDADEHCDCEPTRVYEFYDEQLIDELSDRGYLTLAMKQRNQSILRESAMEKIFRALNNMSDIELDNLANNLK